MSAIETTNFQTAPRLLARYGESRGWLERHIKNHFSPQPVKCSTGSDGRTARRGRPQFSQADQLLPEQIHNAILATYLDREECRARSHQWGCVMRGQKETILAVAELARSAGASCSFEQLRGGHLAAVVGFNGRTGKVILSSTTRDRNEHHIAKRYTRRVLRSLGAVS